MDYEETLKYLYSSLPVFQRIGAAAYKANLNNTLALDEHLGFPHRSFRSVHIGGTNGKGSTSQMIYGALRQSGLKVGLYTSPHLKDFRERIVVDDRMIGRDDVVDFVAANKEFLEQVQPSFFEVTVAMAFDYFRKVGVDVAVVEVGMGGRLDSTNIITPILSVITNIDYDHTQFLGDTLEKIAGEKAGIIKPGIEVVVGQRGDQYNHVFKEKAIAENAPITFADSILQCTAIQGNTFTVHNTQNGDSQEFRLAMQGNYQGKNLCTALVALQIIARQIPLTQQQIRLGIEQAMIKGRWQVLGRNPLIVCDTGHNKAGIGYVSAQIEQQKYDKLYFVIGVVSDKDLPSILGLLPKQAHYIFTQASIERAMPVETLARQATAAGLQGEIAPTVAQALARAKELATADDMIFVGGSTFTVAEVV